MIKQILLMCVLITSIGLACAGEITYTEGSTIHIYGEIEKREYMGKANDEKFNYNKTTIINGTVIEGEIKISSKIVDNYELEYTFIADINESTYISRIVVIKQELLSSSFLSGKVYERTLTIDGVEKAQYQTKSSWFVGTKPLTMYFCLLDNNIRFGDQVINNESLAFTQLNYPDQQTLLLTAIPPPAFPISHLYISVGSSTETGMQLTGITGMIYNACGWVPGLGDSLQSLMFLPLGVVQYTFNFVFSFLFLIINNWWYAVLLLEIFCIIPALTHTDYPGMVATYIETHVKIFKFLYKDVILPTHKFILRIIEIIRNMIPFL